MWTREQLKTKSKAAFFRNYWITVLAGLIFTAINYSPVSGRNSYDTVTDYVQNTDSGSIIDQISSNILVMGVVFFIVAGLAVMVAKIFIGNLLYIGCERFFMENSEKKASLKLVLAGFNSGEYGKKVLTMFLRGLYTTLWSLLLIIPGVIKSYEYSMIPYILAENPNISRERAFQISKAMMMGQKANAWVLDLSYIGWEILGALTLGIVNVFFVTPYHEGAWVELYKVNREKVLQSNEATPMELPGF